MKKAPIPADEIERLAALKAKNVLDTPPEYRFDRITKAVAENLRVPISTISLIDQDREWFKSSVGVSATEGPRESSFCGHTITRGSLFVVEDTHKNKDFADNPQVTNPPHIRFYAGVTLHDHKTHLPIGAFCVKDTKPRNLSMPELNTLLTKAHEAEVELNKVADAGTRGGA